MRNLRSFLRWLKGLVALSPDSCSWKTWPTSTKIRICSQARIRASRSRFRISTTWTWWRTGAGRRNAKATTAAIR